MLTPNAFRKKAERNLAETDGDLVNIGENEIACLRGPH
jgi:hypothetical protein